MKSYKQYKTQAYNHLGVKIGNGVWKQLGNNLGDEIYRKTWVILRTLLCYRLEMNCIGGFKPTEKQKELAYRLLKDQ
jgi:hypothetical protein